MTPTAQALWNNKDFIKWRVVEQLYEEGRVTERFGRAELNKWRFKELLTSIRFIRERFEKRWEELDESTTSGRLVSST